MKEKYLPIGTVVLLKDATKHLMITGYCSSTPEEPNKFYDYVSLLFPEGALAGESVALFDHDQIGSIIHMGLEDENFKKLNDIIKESMASDQTAAAQPVPAANGELPPFTPENINLMLQEIHKHGDEYKPITEPTAFDEEAIKKPVFQLPSLDGGNKKEEKKEEEEEDSSDFNFEEEPIETEEKEVVPDGQPVLQLQPIFEGEAAPSGDNSTASDGGIIGLTRL